MIRGNFHTHTTYCDGKNTVDEMVQAAIGAGLSEIGFSGHAFMRTDETYFMSRENTLRYHEDVKKAKERYADRIAVYCGIEQDVLSEPLEYDYEYKLGAAHYAEHDGLWFAVDHKPEVSVETVKHYFGGDWYKYCASYFNLVGSIREVTGSGLIAHFDLVTKFNEDGSFFDENDRRYRHAAMEAMEHLCESDIVLEINTGAMSRGYRTTPYPSEYLLKEAAVRHIPVMINGDVHAAENIVHGFDLAEALAKKYKLTVLDRMSDLKVYMKQ